MTIRVHYVPDAIDESSEWMEVKKESIVDLVEVGAPSSSPASLPQFLPLKG